MFNALALLFPSRSARIATIAKYVITVARKEILDPIATGFQYWGLARVNPAVSAASTRMASSPSRKTRMPALIITEMGLSAWEATLFGSGGLLGRLRLARPKCRG